MRNAKASAYLEDVVPRAEAAVDEHADGALDLVVEDMLPEDPVLLRDAGREGVAPHVRQLGAAAAQQTQGDAGREQQAHPARIRVDDVGVLKVLVRLHGVGVDVGPVHL